MAGNKHSGRPGGNPDISQYGFKPKGPKPLKAQMNVSITEEMKQKLVQIDNWHDRVREWVDRGLKELEEDAQAS